MRFLAHLFKAAKPLITAAPCMSMQEGMPVASGLSGDVGLDLSDPEFLRNPYPYYAYLRRCDRAHRCKQGAVLLTRHADVCEALADARLRNAPSYRAVTHTRNRQKYVCADVANNILPFLDAPEHQPARRAVTHAFANALRSGVDTDELAREILAQLPPTFDLVRDFGRVIALRTVGALMGLPQTEFEKLSAWSEGFFQLFSPFTMHADLERTERQLAEFRDFLIVLVHERLRAPQSDFISQLATSSRSDRQLTIIEVVDNAMLVFADAIENVDAALANIILAFESHPEQWRRLSENHDLISGAVDEGLRYDSPAQTVTRIAVEDFELHGRSIKQETSVLLGLAAANRDGAVFPDPDRFDIRRPCAQSLAFGRGAHGCIGAALVRLELGSVLRALVARVDTVEILAPPTNWEARLGHRWLPSLNVTLHFAKRR